MNSLGAEHLYLAPRLSFSFTKVSVRLSALEDVYPLLSWVSYHGDGHTVFTSLQCQGGKGERNK